jgi:hypothetical protein
MGEYTYVAVAANSSALLQFESNPVSKPNTNTNTARRPSLRCGDLT